MSQAESSYAARKSRGNIALQATAADDVWRESILVVVLVLAPIGLAVIVMAPAALKNFFHPPEKPFSTAVRPEGA
jgi:hypothetical protein